MRMDLLCKKHRFEIVFPEEISRCFVTGVLKCLVSVRQRVVMRYFMLTRRISGTQWMVVSVVERCRCWLGGRARQAVLLH